MEFKDLSKQLKQKLRGYVRHAYPKGGGTCIQSHNWIVTCGAYTVGMNHETRITELENKDYPSQWEKDTATQIVANVKASNCYGEVVVPEMMYFRDWYKMKIKEINMVLNTIEKYEKYKAGL